ncbi:UPF0705 protein C11orf49 [Nephila pilipes]|uniref:Centriolar satellite-associated tubulin polyglutamylase complex regulator 1 n=1 Tax=Nephila pilipes TaxID=299642 RepID=A0A8X6Q0D1_NEPPI|nr:UPF0705 protein C11orf49 [Nephila pilipes]
MIMAGSGEEMQLLENTNFKKHNIEFYLNDSVAEYLKLRKENPESETTPASFVMEYLDSFYDGTHVLHREFSFVSGTLYNRLCAVKLMTLIYKPLLHLLNILDAKYYHSLLESVFPGFPLSVVQSAFDLSEIPEQEVKLTYVEFVKFLKRSFCVGRFHYRDKIISAQIDSEIEKFSRVSGKLQRGNLSREDFLHFREESGSDEAFMSSIKENNLSVELKRILEIDATSSEESEEETDLRAEFQRLFTLTEVDSTSSEKPAEETSGKISLLPSGSKDTSKGKKNVRHFKERDDYLFPEHRFPSDFGQDSIPLRELCEDSISREKPPKGFDRKLPYSSHGTGTTTKVKIFENPPKEIENKGREMMDIPVISLAQFPGEVKYVGIKQPGLSSGFKVTAEFRKNLNLLDKRDNGRIPGCSLDSNLDLGAKPKRISGSDPFSSGKSSNKNLDLGAKPKRISGSDPFSSGKSSNKIGGKTPRQSFGFKDSFASKQNVRPLDKWFDDHQSMVNTPRLSALHSKSKGTRKIPPLVFTPKILARFKETGEILSEKETLSSGKPDEGTGIKLPQAYSGAKPRKM